MTHVYTIHLSDDEREPLRVVILHTKAQLSYYAVGAETVLRVDIDRVDWLASNGWAELVSGIPNERFGIELAARVLFKDPGATCEEVTEPARTTHSAATEHSQSEPSSDGEVYSALKGRFPSASVVRVTDADCLTYDVKLLESSFRIECVTRHYWLTIGSAQAPLQYPRLGYALDAIARATGDAP